MRKGKVIGIVGDLGAGKTTFIKQFTSGCKSGQIYCYLRISTDWEDKKIVKFTVFESFVRTANTKKDKVFIIDEAYTCLPEKLNIKMDNPENIHNQFVDFLVNSRKMNNFIFIILHSLSQVPSWLIPYLDYFVRFRTNDLLQYQIMRFRSFANIAKNLVEHPTLENHKPVILKLR